MRPYGYIYVCVCVCLCGWMNGCVCVCERARACVCGRSVKSQQGQQHGNQLVFYLVFPRLRLVCTLRSPGRRPARRSLPGYVFRQKTKQKKNASRMPSRTQPAGMVLPAVCVELIATVMMRLLPILLLVFIVNLKRHRTQNALIVFNYHYFY